MKRILFSVMALCLMLFACRKEQVLKEPLQAGNSKSSKSRTSAVNPFKAPLYWNPYEYNITTDGYIPETEWEANINWAETNLKPYGYNMICIDGWGDDGTWNQDGYRTTHSSNWAHNYAWWSANLQSRGMTLGIYNNPLWIIKSAADAGVKIKGTNIPLSSIMNEAENATWFRWVQVDRPGAEQYVKGYVQYYADMGVKFLRVDFLSWFEDGHDQNMGRVGPSRPKEHYETALRWMREACDANGMFLSLVMPHLKNEGELEVRYGDMIRINDDAGGDSDPNGWVAGWPRFNNMNRGIRTLDEWSQYDNTFDGYIYWSKLSGRGKMILDGDFIRLNRYNGVNEKKTAISLHLIAGGPVSVADLHTSIGNDLWLYQNTEMLALNQDGFVGKPLTNDPLDANSQIWKGQMSNGDWVVALFNREDTPQARSINLVTDLGINGNVKVRDLWAHEDIGTTSAYSTVVAAHGVTIVKIVPTGGGPVDGGIYQIKVKHSGKALEIAGNSTTNGALAQQWDYVAAANQKWKIESTGDGYYKLTAAHSNKVLDIAGGSTEENVNAHQWDYSSAIESQRWAFVDIGGGYYKIVNKKSGKVLDVYGASTTNGGAVKQFPYNSGTNQQWSLTLVQNPPVVSGAVYKITARHSGKAIEVAANSLNNGALVQQWGYVGAANQKWKVESTGDGYYKLTATHSNKVLDIFQSSTLENVNAHQWDWTLGASQRWKIEEVSAGYFRIVNKNSGKVLDVYGGSTADGGSVRQFPWDGGLNQQFVLTQL